MLRTQAEYGVSPEEFAVEVFAGIARGDYWLFPYSKFVDPLLEARFDTIRRRKPPENPL